MSEWKKGKDCILLTRGLGPCFGIAIYDPALEEGYLAHLTNPNDGDQRELDEMTQDILSSTSDPSNIKVWLRGGALDLEDTEYGIKARKFTQKYMLELGIMPENLDISWLDDSEDAVDIRFNCQTGLCEINVSPWDDNYYSDEFLSSPDA